MDAVSILRGVTDFLKDQWLGVLGLLGLFQLSKIRREHVLRTRLELVTSTFDVFSEIAEAVAIWASPVNYSGEDKDETFSKKVVELNPKAMAVLHRATLFMAPKTALALERILSLLRRMQMERIIHQTMSAQPVREAYRGDARAAWEEARVHLPRDVKHAHARLLYSLQVVTLGRVRAAWWRMTRAFHRWRYERWLRAELTKAEQRAEQRRQEIARGDQPRLQR
jgi:hypothetical protein